MLVWSKVRRSDRAASVAQSEEIMFDSKHPFATARAYREIAATGCLCFGVLASACASGNDTGQDWTGGAAAKGDTESSLVDESNGNPSPKGSQTSSFEPELEESSEQSPGPSSTNEKKNDGEASESLETSSTGAQEESSSSSASTATSSADASSSSSTSSSDLGSSTSSSSTESSSDSAEPVCEMELCAFLNHRMAPGNKRWRAARHRFSFVAPSPSRRLARIELMQGFGRGRTRVEVRLDDGDSSANLLTRLTWEFNLPTSKQWQGAKLERPEKMPAGRQIWMTVEPVAASLASIAAAGREIPLWYEQSPQRWVEKRAPVMYRVFCCKEE